MLRQQLLGFVEVAAAMRQEFNMAETCMNDETSVTVQTSPWECHNLKYLRHGSLQCLERHTSNFITFHKSNSHDIYVV